MVNDQSINLIFECTGRNLAKVNEIIFLILSYLHGFLFKVQ